MSVQNQTNPVNNAHKSYKQGRTTFPVTYLHYTTELYGYVQPFFAMEGVEGDTIPLNSKEDLRTHTMSAPLMSKVTKNKDYYAIPMRAILPRTWEQIYANPTQGDDIPEDANCTMPISTIMNHISQVFSGQYDTTLVRELDNARQAIKFIFFAESILSSGSLLAKMGIHLNPLFEYFKDADETSEFRKPFDYDQWFDMVFVPWLKRINPIITVNGQKYAIAFDGQPLTFANTDFVSIHRFCELCRDYADFSLNSVNLSEEDSNLTLDSLFGNPINFVIYIPQAVRDEDGTSIPGYLNIGRLLAYQLVSFHFYTNDKIDSIYSAQLYRGLMQSLAGDVVAGTGNANAANINSIRKYYTYNGELLEYDLFSEAVFKTIFDTISFSTNIFTSNANRRAQIERCYGFLRNIFGYTRSLRYGDYFTGSRPSPLAVGDINTPVVSEGVNAIDMTKSLLMQRFLNSVNRVGRKFSNYVQMLSGRTPAPEPTNPQFLAHSVNEVGSFEVENTAENQGNIVTLMRDGNSRYAFSYDVNEPCIVLGVSWYEVARIYSKTIDRHAFHRTRFDMFNKFFQYQGDQSIFRKELNARWLTFPDQNFAYTLRYMEYKQRASIATGGFVSHLPAYAFVTDNGSVGDFRADQNISPEYIRSRPSEFDRFYSALTGASLGSYFHFIVRYVNECNAERPMEYAPSVL